MATKNQHSGGVLRCKRLPTMAVSEYERERVEQEAHRLHMTMAQLVRCGLVLLGVLDTGSLDDVDTAIAAQISTGKGLGPLRRAK